MIHFMYVKKLKFLVPLSIVVILCYLKYRRLPRYSIVAFHVTFLHIQTTEGTSPARYYVNLPIMMIAIIMVVIIMVVVMSHYIPIYSQCCQLVFNERTSSMQVIQ